MCDSIFSLARTGLSLLTKSKRARMTGIRPQPPMVAILVAAFPLIIHAPIVLSDARFLDGTYFEYYLEQGRWEVITWNFYNVSMQLWAWMLWPLLGTTHPGWWLQLAELLSLAVIGLCVERSARLHANLPQEQSLFLGMLVTAFPAYGSTMMSNTVVYIFPDALFYLGWTLYLDRALCGQKGLFRSALAFGLLWVSFHHNSLLAFHYGLLAIFLVLFAARQESPSSLIRFWAGVGLAFLKRHWLITVLPVLFFALRQVLLPKSSPFGTHNQLVLDLPKNFRAFAGSFYHHVVLNLSAAFASQAWLLAVVLAVSAGILAYAWRREPTSRQTVWIALLGALMAVLAILPYAAVAKAAPLQSFGARYGMLSGLGGSLIILAIWRVLPQRAALRLIVAVVFLAGLTWRGLSDDLMWLGRWAKDKAAVVTLAELPAPVEGTVLLWDDSWRIGRETYRPFELSWFFRKAWGREAWLGIDLLERDPDAFLREDSHTRLKRYYILSDFIQNGCTQIVTVRAADDTIDPVRLGSEYLVRHLAAPGTLDAFLKSLIDLKISPAECSQITSSLALPPYNYGMVFDQA
ncbi:membrane hypothetical protein [Rhodospirillaceae bacterium LM-1]|nr:membrane hypothetical protein [Rhodospirillaceae bacterium LM-1]